MDIVLGNITLINTQEIYLKSALTARQTIRDKMEYAVSNRYNRKMLQELGPLHQYIILTPTKCL